MVAKVSSRPDETRGFYSQLEGSRVGTMIMITTSCLRLRSGGSPIRAGPPEDPLRLDTVGRQFEPSLPVEPLWCDLGLWSRTVVVIKLRLRTSAFTSQLESLIPGACLPGSCARVRVQLAPSHSDTGTGRGHEWQRCRHGDCQLSAGRCRGGGGFTERTGRPQTGPSVTLPLRPGQVTVRAFGAA